MNSAYKVGSSVYLVYNINGAYQVCGMLSVDRVSKDDRGFHYSLRNELDEPIDWCYEDDVFGTYEGAMQVCGERNGKL